MSVSDNGATAPISALTYAFIFVSNRGQPTDDLGRRIIAKSRLGGRVVKLLDNRGEGSAADEAAQLQGRGRREPAWAAGERSHVQVPLLGRCH